MGGLVQPTEILSRQICNEGCEADNFLHAFSISSKCTFFSFYIAWFQLSIDVTVFRLLSAILCRYSRLLFYVALSILFF